MSMKHRLFIAVCSWLAILLPFAIQFSIFVLLISCVRFVYRVSVVLLQIFSWRKFYHILVLKKNLVLDSLLLDIDIRV